MSKKKNRAVVSTSPKSTSTHPTHSKQRSVKITQQQRFEEFSGPIPHPDLLRKYNDILPNAAERIMTMAENQSNHRIKMESTVINSNTLNSRLGVIFAFIIAVLAIASGTLLIMNGKVIEGSLFGGGVFGSIVYAFIYGTNSNRREREHKNKDMQDI